jgi:hypothetical protein
MIQELNAIIIINRIAAIKEDQEATIAGLNAKTNALPKISLR